MIVKYVKEECEVKINKEFYINTDKILLIEKEDFQLSIELENSQTRLWLEFGYSDGAIKEMERVYSELIKDKECRAMQLKE